MDGWCVREFGLSLDFCGMTLMGRERVRDYWEEGSRDRVRGEIKPMMRRRLQKGDTPRDSWRSITEFGSSRTHI